MAPALFPRFASRRVVEALGDSPVILIHGPRQCGKTTLARMVGDKAGYDYFTFDDPATRDAALGDPVGFIADLPAKAIIDEVQHLPQIFAVIKAAVDRDRRPGRFILTGSANVLLLPKVSDSLDGPRGTAAISNPSSSAMFAIPRASRGSTCCRSCSRPPPHRRRASSTPPR